MDAAVATAIIGAAEEEVVLGDEAVADVIIITTIAYTLTAGEAADGPKDYDVTKVEEVTWEQPPMTMKIAWQADPIQAVLVLAVTMNPFQHLPMPTAAEGEDEVAGDEIHTTVTAAVEEGVEEAGDVVDPT